MSQYLIINENTLCRETITSCLYSLESDSIIYESESIDLASNITQYYQTIDTVILCLSCPENECLDNLSRLKAMLPDARCMIISQLSSKGQVESLLENGANAVISVSSNRNQFISAIRSINSGQTYVCEEYLKNSVPAAPVKTNGQAPKLNGYSKFKLTKRQKQVLSLIIKGYANKLIAYELGVSEGTIKLHVSSILRAMKVTNRTEAALRADQFFNSHQIS